MIRDIRMLEAGNATFTIVANDGSWRTYRIKESKRFRAPSVYYATVLTGPDNTNDFTYIGRYTPVDDGGPEIELTPRSKFKLDTELVQMLRIVLKVLAAGYELPEGWELQHEGRCMACGRKLTTPESIRKGIGPQCEERVFG